MAGGNKQGHRHFGNIRQRDSGRYQIRYPGPDGRMRNGKTTYERKTDAAQALSLIEAEIIRGDWIDPDAGKVPLGEYAAAWIKERPGLRPKTVENYTWLLRRHIVPVLGGVDVGKVSAQMVRTWRAGLLDDGISVSTTAKAYRLLRAVLTTAVDQDNMLPRNPCRIKGADNEHTPERPILTVEQVFELAERIGRRPIGNVRKLPCGSYRLRYREPGADHTCPSPELYPTRQAAHHALWMLADDGMVHIEHDHRFRALVLLSTFASLRWGEAIALCRGDVDLKARTVRVDRQLTEMDTGEMVIGPPKSRAGKRTLGIPAVLVSYLQAHLDEFVDDRDDAYLFLGVRGGFLRGSNFRRAAGWNRVLSDLEVDGLHFHDLRHTGNTLVAQTGASLADLKARMGQDSDRAALIYQHATQTADQVIASALDERVRTDRAGHSGDDDRSPGDPASTT